jgi:HEAT repeat protein
MGKNSNPSWLPILIKELDSADAEIRYEAVGACGELGEEEAVPHLIRLITDPDADTDADAQLTAIRALGKIGGPEAKNCLENYLDSPSEAIQQATEQALNELGIGEEPLPF